MMKDKLLQIRVDDDFISKIEYLKTINGYGSIAETVRKIIEKEFRKENQKSLCDGCVHNDNTMTNYYYFCSSCFRRQSDSSLEDLYEGRGA